MQHLMEGFVIFVVCIGVLLAEIMLLLWIGQGGRFLAMSVLKPCRCDFTALGRRLAPARFTIRQETVPPVSRCPCSHRTWQSGLARRFS